MANQFGKRNKFGNMEYSRDDIDALRAIAPTNKDEAKINVLEQMERQEEWDEHRRSVDAKLWQQEQDAKAQGLEWIPPVVKLPKEVPAWFNPRPQLVDATEDYFYNRTPRERADEATHDELGRPYREWAEKQKRELTANEYFEQQAVDGFFDKIKAAGDRIAEAARKQKEQ